MIATSGGNLILLGINGTEILEVVHRKLDKEVACLNISPFGEDPLRFFISCVLCVWVSVCVSVCFTQHGYVFCLRCPYVSFLFSIFADEHWRETREKEREGAGEMIFFFCRCWKKKVLHSLWWACGKTSHWEFFLCLRSRMCHGKNLAVILSHAQFFLFASRMLPTCSVVLVKKKKKRFNSKSNI